MTDFKAAYDRYNGANHDTRAALWDLCVTAYTETKPSNPYRKSIRQLSESIGGGIDREDTVSDWCRVGHLIMYTYGVGIRNISAERYDLKRLWSETDALSYDHLLRMAKLAKRLELDPGEILERLYNAIYGTQGKPQTADSLERDVEETHEPQEILLRRDLQRIGKRLKQNIDSLEFRGASSRLVLAFKILERRMSQELKRLEAIGDGKR